MLKGTPRGTCRPFLGAPRGLVFGCRRIAGAQPGVADLNRHPHSSIRFLGFRIRFLAVRTVGPLRGKLPVEILKLGGVWACKGRARIDYQ